MGTRGGKTVIIGAGLTGLSCAWHLGPEAVLLEAEPSPGGLVRTERLGDFLFDRTGHWLHLRDPAMTRFVNDLLGDQLEEIERRSRVYTHGRWIDFPFQSHLAGLPPEVALRCLQDAITARLGPPAEEAADFETFSRRLFGDGITEEFLIPYNRKLWGIEPARITADWCGRFFPRPDLDRILRGALGVAEPVAGYNARFVYPRTGGIETLSRALATGARDLRLGQPVRRIDPRRGHVETPQGFQAYERIVSTIPLPALVSLVERPPKAILSAAARLRCTRLRYVLFGVRGLGLPQGAHWAYLPDPTLPFYRVGCASNAVGGLAPPGHSTLCLEVGNDHRLDDEAVLAAGRQLLQDLGVIAGPHEIVVEAMRELPSGYVIFDPAWREARRSCLGWLEELGIISTGRFGAWEYSSMEDALLQGREAARRCREGFAAPHVRGASGSNPA